MPQMAPMNWFMLFIVFSLFNLMFNIVFTSITKYTPSAMKMTGIKNNQSQLNNENLWKW